MAAAVMEETSTLFERIGGEQGVRSLAIDFYRKVLADPDLQGFFVNVPMPRLYAMQYEFFAAALGGPVKYSGLPFFEAHRERGITRAHMRSFVGHLIDTLRDWKLSEQDILEIMARF